MSLNFQEIAIYHILVKAVPLLNPFSSGILWKNDIKFFKNSNFKQSYLKN